ncbi:hypothetical protein [Lactobacillus delbrueckii]|uniref:hypothetical protein n=1 Tax=Lactobacillus delbrueckii TaxID=1584 RepID=UPI0039918F62
MKKFQRVLAVLSAMLGLITIISYNTQTVSAVKYGRGKQIVVPKDLRGKWYSYDVGRDSNKHVIKFTKYTFSGSLGNNMHIYARNGYPSYHYYAQTKKQIAENRAIEKASKHWVAGYYSRIYKKRYFCVGYWYSMREHFPSFRRVNRRINGKKVGVLVYFNGYNWANYYPTKALAKQYKNVSIHGYKDLSFK